MVKTKCKNKTRYSQLYLIISTISDEWSIKSLKKLYL